ncbi:MAG: ParB/RepB/Spo0J family partition protein [Deltaproteobacteria bacterium]|jgi:ParB family chromosome partitioning protein|nr:ParB/RepB/Spo0J family partition protein [Deltaproteobacteria bacterium]
MTKKKGGLGSSAVEKFGLGGIDTLYGDAATAGKTESEASKTANGLPLMVSIEKISVNPDQPRKYFNSNEMNKLSDSVRAKGIIEPLVVRPLQNDTYQLLVGHRRLLASKQAGFKEVPVIFKDIPDDSRQRLEIAMLENIFRENLNPIEEAEGFYRLEKEIGQDVLEIARLFGKDRSTISNSIRLLELPEEIKDDIRTGILSAGHGKAILSIQDQTDRLTARNFIVEKSLSVRNTENLAKKLNNKNKPANLKDDPDKELLENLSSSFSKGLGLQVVFKSLGKKKKMEIYYNKIEDIEIIMNKLGVSIVS